MNRINKALEIARIAHAGQKDKAGFEYIFHPITVALNCETEEEKIVGLLHDTVEDTSVTLADLSIFGSDIVEAVDAITKKDGQSIEEYMHVVKNNPIARKVKLSDLTHNMDLTRIPEVTEKDLKRIEKYKKEYAFLSDETTTQFHME